MTPVDSEVREVGPGGGVSRRRGRKREGKRGGEEGGEVPPTGLYCTVWPLEYCGAILVVCLGVGDFFVGVCEKVVGGEGEKGERWGIICLPEEGDDEGEEGGRLRHGGR